MSWDSKTHQFGQEEMTAIEATSAEDLVGPISGSDAVVALRVLAELMLHGDDARLVKLLDSADINKRWTAYRNDFGVDERDHSYASQLRVKLPRSQAVFADMLKGYQYPKEDPHWVQATKVQESTISGYVRVWIGDKDYGVQRAGWSNPFFDKTKSDCLVEDSESGWLKIWWYDADVLPR